VAKRPMTFGEISLAISVYGQSIDYTKVSIFDTASGYTPGRISSPDGNIHYPRGTNQTSWYSSDISTNDLVFHGVPIAQGTLIHELGHVYQYQHGVKIIGRALEDRFSNFVAGIFGDSKDDYDFRSYIKNGVPFSEWDIESQAQYFEEMYYRALGKKGLFPDITNEELKAVNDGGILQIAPGDLRCFPAATSIMMSDGQRKAIKDVKVGDVIMAFSSTPGFVSRRAGA
jgi:hypothetical protein